MVKMCRQYLLIVGLLGAICLASSETPPFITKCSLGDSKCMTENAVKAIPIFTAGLPKYKVPVLDPFSIKHIDATQGNLAFLLDDVTIAGLKNCKAKNIEKLPSESSLRVEVLCSGQLDGQYQLKGSLLLFEVNGKGKIHVDLNDVLINIVIEYDEKVGKDGNNHLNIKSWTHKFELQGKSKVEFDDLFKGNEVLGRATDDFIKNNSNDVVYEIGPEVINVIVAKVVKSVKHFFDNAPITDLLL